LDLLDDITMFCGNDAMSSLLASKPHHNFEGTR